MRTRVTIVHLHSGLKIVEIAMFISASIFNEGHSTVLRIMDSMGIIVGRQSHEYAKSKDAERVKRQDARTALCTVEARKARKELKQMSDNMFEEAEGLLYGPGIAD